MLDRVFSRLFGFPRGRRFSTIQSARPIEFDNWVIRYSVQRFFFSFSTSSYFSPHPLEDRRRCRLQRKRSSRTTERTSGRNVENNDGPLKWKNSCLQFALNFKRKFISIMKMQFQSSFATLRDILTLKENKMRNQVR